MSEEASITRTLAGLRQNRARHEAVERWLRFLLPAVLAVFVLAAYQAHPAPGLAGRSLVVSAAAAGYLLGILGVVILLGGPGTPARTGRGGGTRLAAGVAVILLASSVALLWAQPQGPGASGAFLGVLLLARLWPGRTAVAVTAGAFAVLEALVYVRGQGLAGLTILGVLAACYGVWFLAVRLRRASEEVAALVAELEQSRAAEARAAGLAERQRLAREMHDVLAHSLSGLLLQLEGARMLAAGNPADPRLTGAIERARQLGRTGLDEARRAIGTLRDDELPGPERLDELTARFADDRGIPCQLEVSGEARPLDSEASLAVYRVAQEALTNITKHARPDQVGVRLVYTPSATRLTVEDFAQAPPAGAGDARSGGTLGASGGGYGLTGMRERAELLGGTLTAGKTGSGFRVELELPA